MDGIVILAIVIINAILGFTQEYRAEQAMEALKELAQPETKVRRDGKLQKIPSKELVPGDIVVIEAGDAISADSRLVEAANLRAPRSLTYWRIRTSLQTHRRRSKAANIPLGDRKNMLYMGTAANYGRGVAVVTEHRHEYRA